MICQSKDGKRLILEIGCNSVIYILNKVGSKLNYHVFIQSTKSFIWDVTTGYVASQVSQKTAPMVTIVKYEMYFLLGLISTISIPALIIVTGSDITYNASVALNKYNAVKKLSSVLSIHGQKLRSSSPTLYKKFIEFVESEKKIKWKEHGKQLPETIAKDEKTQAQLSGILVGKAIISPKALTGWAALFTILSSLAIKSVTKTPEAYSQVFKDRYQPVIKELIESNWANPQQKQKAAERLISILKESQVNLSSDEVFKIIGEVKNNPSELRKILVDISKSINEFVLAVK